jgi:hypothetical protein
MDSNFTKNTFFDKLLNLDSCSGILSLKQLIQGELLNVIDLYQQHLKVNIRQQIAVLADKIVLSNSQNSVQGLVYTCAIAFPIANMVGLSPLLVAHQLVSLLPSLKETSDTSLAIAVTVTKLGWLEFRICDRFMLCWLERLVAAIQQSDRELLPFPTEKSENFRRLFPLQYISIRCTSLLRLGAREGLITLAELEDLKWQIKQPMVINWRNSQGDLCLVSSQERDLLWQICLMLDYIAANQKYNLKHWLQFTDKMSVVWLRFVAKCTFCGEIKQQNLTLATARLGLIALTYWCLQTILSRLDIITLKDIELAQSSIVTK